MRPRYLLRMKKVLLPIFCAAFAIFALGENIPDRVLPESEYPYWGGYKKTNFEDVKPAEWIAEDSVKDGWDWSLPPRVKPDPNSYVTLYRTGMNGMGKIAKIKPVNFPSIPVVGFWLNWKDIEKTEGVYDFQPLKDMIKAAAEKGYGSVIRIHTAATRFAPEWLFKYNVPVDENPEGKGDRMKPIDPAHPEFHKRYLKLVEAFGKSGIPQMDEVKGMFVGYSSYSNGDEGMGPVPEHENPDGFPHVRERIDAWAEAAKGVERKVFMGGWSDYGISKGFGIRRGFVEMYLYHIPDEKIGQKIDKDGYLYVDEENPVVKSGVRNGEENEEYEEHWASERGRYRFGKSTASFPYRYFSSNLRLLQMRTNDVIWNEFTINPEMFVWVGLELGKTAKTAPDAWCFLRESYLWKSNMRRDEKGAEDPNTGLKNFERWVYQRDSPGYETEPAVKIGHAIKMWMVRDDRRYDYVARTGAKIGFDVDGKFLRGRSRKIAVKISYFDFGKGKFALEYNSGGEVGRRVVECADSGKVRTATFFITADFLKNMKLKHDLEITGIDGYKPTISMLRVVKP